MIGSGLPSNTVWVRVERARAAAHWRPAPAARPDPDPQRHALPADVADLLLPVAHPAAASLLSVQLLRLAKVPLFPPAEYVQRALGVARLTEEELGAACDASGAEALLPLLRAARRLPAAHPARPAHAAHAAHLLALLLDPPHYFTDRAGASRLGSCRPRPPCALPLTVILSVAGYLSWVNALWEASCEWATGERRLALLCWRLRWLHALLLLADGAGEGDGAEARRIVSEARGALRRHAAGSPVAYALFARLHAAAAGAAGAERGRHAALQALRAALADGAVPATHRLYVARVATELGAGEWGAWPVLCAALGVPLPEHFSAAPHPQLLESAIQLVSKGQHVGGASRAKSLIAWFSCTHTVRTAVCGGGSAL